MVFLGYRVKQPWEPGPGWSPIRLICCVGDSLCEPPESWVERWDFDRAFCYDSPQAAWETVVGDRTPYRLFAYEILPLNLQGSAEPQEKDLNEIFHSSFPALPSSPAPVQGMVELGYDIAECQYGELGFPYSPLVNNGFANEFPTNAYGLLDDLDVAIQACRTINEVMPEHAPHRVFRVFAQNVDVLSAAP